MKIPHIKSLPFSLHFKPCFMLKYDKAKKLQRNFCRNYSVGYWFGILIMQNIFTFSSQIVSSCIVCSPKYYRMSRYHFFTYRPVLTEEYNILKKLQRIVHHAVTVTRYHGEVSCFTCENIRIKCLTSHLSTIKDLNSFDNTFFVHETLPLLLTVSIAGPLCSKNTRTFIYKHLVTRTIPPHNRLVLAGKQSPETDRNPQYGCSAFFTSSICSVYMNRWIIRLLTTKIDQDNRICNQ